ncbi:hypothetical protein AV530_020110 [Patagioenas fasciata monilis]|uniref:Uncharacterized protein n=1 Tax=Patagioenas fasciata monilis TaxID=372326 RepID=A0A1V4JIH9_PATFA|nr:hypothetical protein AV530_020110 [Patagioenas fasciata monilis]
MLTERILMRPDAAECINGNDLRWKDKTCPVSATQPHRVPHANEGPLWKPTLGKAVGAARTLPPKDFASLVKKETAQRQFVLLIGIQEILMMSTNFCGLAERRTYPQTISCVLGGCGDTLSQHPAADLQMSQPTTLALGVPPPSWSQRPGCSSIGSQEHFQGTDKAAPCSRTLLSPSISPTRRHLPGAAVVLTFAIRDVQAAKDLLEKQHNFARFIIEKSKTSCDFVDDLTHL